MDLKNDTLLVVGAERDGVSQETLNGGFCSKTANGWICSFLQPSGRSQRVSSRSTQAEIGVICQISFIYAV